MVAWRWPAGLGWLSSWALPSLAASLVVAPVVSERRPDGALAQWQQRLTAEIAAQVNERSQAVAAPGGASFWLSATDLKLTQEPVRVLQPYLYAEGGRGWVVIELLDFKSFQVLALTLAAVEDGFDPALLRRLVAGLDFERPPASSFLNVRLRDGTPAGASPRMAAASHALQFELRKGYPELALLTERGGENLRRLHRMQRGPQLEARHRVARILRLHWETPRPNSLVLGGTWHASEAVWGQQAVSGTLEVNLPRATGETLSPADIPASLGKMLEAWESERGDSSASFTVLARRGAWGYLDRGRAWGLRLGDRLVVPGEAAKGHVVRFFGLEAGLTDPRSGLPLADGAIIYVRKGQSLTRPGQVWTWDSQQYPTPFPPHDSP